jgi:succinate dehydrogenase/fumarate reductase flavoprotein subunit
VSQDAGIVRDAGRADLETDVVVVGGGGCGLAAAIAAVQAGVDVLVLEKQTRPWCNTARSGGMIPAAGTRFQRAAGIVESPEAMAEDILRKNGYASDPDATRDFCRVATGLVEWLVDEVGVAPACPRSTRRTPATRAPEPDGAALSTDLRRAVAPAHRLVEARAQPV